MTYVPAGVSPELMDTEKLRVLCSTDGTGGFVFVTTISVGQG